MNRVVKAAFGAFRSARTRTLYQWDYGMVLQFVGLELPDAYEVHFANQPMAGIAKTMLGGPEGVDIPDEYLTTGNDVYAWVFLHEGESDGESVYMVTIPVQQRPRPTEEAPTPVQQGLIDRALVLLDEAVESTAADADRAEAAAAGIDGALRALWDYVWLLSPLAAAHGDVVTVSDAAPIDAANVTFDILRQDLHGYDRPWAGGTGKNLIDEGGYAALQNLTYADGVYTGNGFYSSTCHYINGTQFVANPIKHHFRDKFTVTVQSQGNNVLSFGYGGTDGMLVQYDLSALEDGDYTVSYDAHMGIVSTSGSVISTISHVQIERGTEATAYEPYANVCPIEGRTGARLTVNGESVDITWESEAGTVYGGKLDVTEGTLTVYPYYASYAGEALAGPWVSSLDAYAPGATPTEGAQVVDLGGEATVYHIAQHAIPLARGENTLFADCGEMTLRYRRDLTRGVTA